MKKTSYMTNQELQAYFKEHVVYEYNMLIETARWLAGHGFGQDPVVRNALVESFALHTRNLIEFFSTKRPRDTDVCAKHYLPLNVGFALDKDLESEKNQADKQIAHLTTVRSHKPEEKSWDVNKITCVLGKAFNRFLEVADKEKVPSAIAYVSLSLPGHTMAISSSPSPGSASLFTCKSLSYATDPDRG